MHREYSDAELQKALKETMSGCLSQTAARALYGVAEKTLDTYAQIKSTRRRCCYGTARCSSAC